MATIRSTATTTSALVASSTLCQPTNSTGVVQLAQPADSSPRPSNTCDQGGGSTCFASEGTLWHLSGWIRSQSTCSPHSPLPEHQSVVLLLHPELFSTCPLACRRERDVLTAHSAETPQGGRTHPSTVVNALTTPHCASLGLGTAQTALGSGTNISCNTPLRYMLFVSFFFVHFVLLLCHAVAPSALACVL